MKSYNHMTTLVKTSQVSQCHIRQGHTKTIVDLTSESHPVLLSGNVFFHAMVSGSYADHLPAICGLSHCHDSTPTGFLPTGFLNCNFVSL